jgi:hypothetical protein
MKRILPSLYINILSVIWIIPFMVIFRIGDGDTWAIFLVILAGSLVLGLLVFVLGFFAFRWEDLDIWKKYFIIIGAYFLNYPLSLFSLFYLMSKKIGLFEGCGGGSIYLFYLPVGFLYVFAGAIFCVVYNIINKKPFE